MYKLIYNESKKKNFRMVYTIGIVKTCFNVQLFTSTFRFKGKFQNV